MSLYPEGGELIAGLLNRVYVEAFTPARKPADLAAVVVDEAGREVARFRSEHEGRGRFEFTPKENHQYKLKITEPAGIQTLFPLPPVKAEGAVIRAARDMFRKQEPVRVGIAATTRDVIVTIARREVMLSRQVPAFGDGRQATVTFELPDSADGVLDGRPYGTQAAGRWPERLVFRQPARSVCRDCGNHPTRKRYSPTAAKTRLNVQTTDRTGRAHECRRRPGPLPTTSKIVLEMIDKREQAGQSSTSHGLSGKRSARARRRAYLSGSKQ